MILRRTHEDITITKWTDDAIRRLNVINKKQKSAKGLLFGDRQNEIDAVTITGVNNTLIEDQLDENDAYDFDIYDPHSNY